MHWSTSCFLERGIILCMSVASRSLFLVVTTIVILASTLPLFTHAVGFDADAICVASNCVVVKTNPKDPRPICATVICRDATSGFSTTGFCKNPTQCQAVSTSGPNGFGLDQVQKILGDLFGKLMQQAGQGGSGSGSGSGAGTGTTCSTYTQTSDQLIAASNPCYQYVPSVSSTLNDTTGVTGVGNNVSDLLNQALGGSTNGGTNSNTNTNTVDVGTVLSQATGSGATATSSASTTPQVIFSTTQAVSNPANQANLAPGFSGDIKLLNAGGTVFGGSRDTVTNTVTTGFFGADTLGAQPQSVVGNLCKNRPWASNFLSYVVPATFFDSLCSLRGYTVGTPAPAQTTTVTVVQSAPQQTGATPAAPTKPVSTVEPKVDIWASPATVPLGSRTLIFWTSQGVEQCTEASPDGNFSQSTFSGGASTAPITGPTTFTISCLTADGTPITDNVTVNIAI